MSKDIANADISMTKVIELQNTIITDTAIRPSDMLDLGAKLIQIATERLAKSGSLSRVNASRGQPPAREQ